MMRYWSVQEEEILIRMYPTARRKDILEKLSGRRWITICSKAASIGIRRSKEAAYDVEYRKWRREITIQRYIDRPELRKINSEKTKALYKNGIRKSPLVKMGVGQESTPYEKLAWVFLEPLGFEREISIPTGKPGGTYKLDFGHHKLKIDIEIDGEQHRETDIQNRDKKRDEYLKKLGWYVIRIENWSISTVILKILKKRLP